MGDDAHALPRVMFCRARSGWGGGVAAVKPLILVVRMLNTREAGISPSLAVFHLWSRFLRGGQSTISLGAIECIFGDRNRSIYGQGHAIRRWCTSSRLKAAFLGNPIPIPRMTGKPTRSHDCRWSCREGVEIPTGPIPSEPATVPQPNPPYLAKGDFLEFCRL